MALDVSYKGKSFDPFTFEVERGKIREFCQAIGDDTRQVIGRGQNFPGAEQPTLSSGAIRLSEEERGLD